LEEIAIVFDGMEATTDVQRRLSLAREKGGALSEVIAEHIDNHHEFSSIEKA
jgi:hypothetical protein